MKFNPKTKYVLAAVAVVLLRCGVASLQQAYVWVGGAPLDDELMFRAAQSITAGQWLGAYDYLTLSKAMFFPVWLAALHALRVPYLVGGAALWCAAALAVAGAFAPLWRQRPHAARYTLGLFALLAFLPSSWASYTLRVYRDNIFPALCLLFFAGLSGAALRAVSDAPRQKPLGPWLLLAGAGLTCAYLDREDAGLFLLPFAAVGTVIVLVVLARQRRWGRCAALALPYAMLAAGVLTFCGLNYTHYGVFALSDFSEGSFAAAMGAMMRVDTDSDEGLLSVPADAREKIYAAVPELEPLAYWLEEDEQLQNDFRDPSLDDYRAGSFYWAIRRAAQFEGIYDSAQTAADYWQTVADKINAACDDGTLPSRTGRRAATNQPIKAAYVAPTLRETAQGLWHVLTFRDCAPYETALSLADPDSAAVYTAYLHDDMNSAAVAGTDEPYYTPLQKAVFAVLAAVTLVWRVALPVGLVLACVAFVAGAGRIFRSRTAGAVVPWLLLLGLLGMALLRCAMIAFVEVSSFGIGTSTMYLATVHPLLVLFCFGALTRYGLPHKAVGRSGA